MAKTEENTKDGPTKLDLVEMMVDTHNAGVSCVDNAAKKRISLVDAIICKMEAQAAMEATKRRATYLIVKRAGGIKGLGPNAQAQQEELNRRLDLSEVYRADVAEYDGAVLDEMTIRNEVTHSEERAAMHKALLYAFGGLSER